MVYPAGTDPVDIDSEKYIINGNMDDSDVNIIKDPDKIQKLYLNSYSYSNVENLPESAKAYPVIVFLRKKQYYNESEVGFLPPESEFILAS